MNYSQTKEYRREYMRKRRADPEYRAKEYARNNLLDKRPEAKVKHAETTRNRNRLRKIKAVEYLGGRCNKCGKDWHPAVFEFHHIDPKEKDLQPSQALQMSWENFKKELDKCILLCANCHRMVHHNYNCS